MCDKLCCCDIFGRKLEIGDKVLTNFTYGHGHMNSVAEVVGIDSLSVTLTGKLTNMKIPESYDSYLKEKTWIAYNVFKLDKEDYNCNFGDFKLYDNFKNLDIKALFEITGRNLKTGDLVLVFDKKNILTEKCVYGLVISNTQILTLNGIIRNRHCFLIEHIKDDTKNVYNQLIKLYNDRINKKLFNSNVEYEVGDFLSNNSSSLVYLYLGKKEINVNIYDTSKKEMKCLKIFQGYIYLKFNLNVHIDRYLYDSLITNNYISYDYASPLDANVFNARQAIGQQINMKDYYDGKIQAFSILSTKKKYLNKLGHIDLSFIKPEEEWIICQRRSPYFKSYKYKKKYIYLTIMKMNDIL